MATFKKDEVAQALRELAATIEDDNDVVTAQEIATYVETTADYVYTFGTEVRITAKQLYAEVAMAWLAGYEHATGDTPRAVHRAMSAVGLKV